jgi:alpha-mannosidase
MNLRLAISGLCLMLLSLPAKAEEKPSFVDGFHGGVEGHYPRGTTRFIVDMMRRHSQWKVCLEVEPATWQSECAQDAIAYRDFKQLLADFPDRVEFVSGAYGQPYCWNIDGESLIRHFSYGIEEIHKQFPNVPIKTYASEEPCWTSCLPQILKSLGFSYAVLKNPLTAWGGYCAGKDAETVAWIGPDGSRIATVPRYAVERDNGNCWETQAAYNRTDYIKKARDAGIVHPVGMCFQDAGWAGGPWGFQTPSINRTWREYFERVADKPKTDWRLSQEDIHVSLVWGSQSLQGIAQSVRRAENKILATEKIAAMAMVEAGGKWPDADFREAWRTLMLSQHHDCWIVPLNAHPAGTWAKQVTADWIPNTQRRCDAIISRALRDLAPGGSASGKELFVRVVNPVSVDRREAVAVALPNAWGANPVGVLDGQNREVPCQVNGTTPSELVFAADVPSLGFATYRITPAADAPRSRGARAEIRSDGAVVVETSQYSIVLDPAKGGCFKRLYDKTLRHEFVDRASPRRFNEYRGYSDSAKAWISSADAKAILEVVEKGPVRVVVAARGKIGDHPFVSTLTAQEGQKQIAMKVRVNWIGRPRIGQPWGDSDVSRSMAKPFYDDRFKLQAVLPSALGGPVTLYKGAAFDVCQSRNDDSFFDNWRSIKHNVVTHFVDVNDAKGEFGLALMSDHTTSYAFGPADPLGLVLAYAGKGLWNRTYSLIVPSEVRYAILPHGGTWDQARVWGEDSRWNEPMLAQMMTDRTSRQPPSKALVRTSPGTYVTAMFVDRSALIIRLFNAEGDGREQAVTFGFVPSDVTLIELDGRPITPLGLSFSAPGEATVKLTSPRFGIRTLRLAGVVKPSA